MKKFGTAKTVMVMVMVLIMGTTGSALAYRGWGGQGQDDYGCPGDGYGWKRSDGPRQGGWDCPRDGSGWKRGGKHGNGYGMRDMSQEDIAKMDQLRQKFFEETKTLRSDLRSKNFELRSELAKENPDLTTVKNIQKELSALESQMDQKRIEHQLEMRKVNPDAGRGFKMGYGPRGDRGGYGDCRR